MSSYLPGMGARSVPQVLHPLVRALLERVPGAAARIPSARLVTLQAGGHLFLQHADEVRAAVRTFLDDVVPAASTS